MHDNRDYDPSGPCGPTAFWKISDREPKSDDQQVLLNDFLPIVDGYEEDFDGEEEEEDDVLPQYIDLDLDWFMVGDDIWASLHAAGKNATVLAASMMNTF